VRIEGRTDGDYSMSVKVPDGWEVLKTQAFGTHVGPFYRPIEGDGSTFGFWADERHGNKRGVVHGGMLMTFADQAFGELVLDAIDRRQCATIQMNTHFIAAVQIGDFVEARGEIVRVTRSLIFMRGFLVVGERNVAAIDGIWKVLHAT